jgi:hypothetical protein
MKLGMLPQELASRTVMQIVDHLDTWAIKTPEAYRNVACGPTGMFAINPMLAIKHDADITYLYDTIKETVAEGRMIHFGNIPNQIIKEESTRSRDLFENNEFEHPFTSWLATTSWEGGFNGYHISRHPLYPDEILVIETYGVSIPGATDVLFVYDMISIEIKGPGNTMVRPHHMNYPAGMKETERQAKYRGSNSLDPLVIMLRLLADNSIPVEHVEAPERLNKSRAKLNKPPIPSHTVVHTRDYVARMQQHTASVKSGHKGGTHASPVAHWRRAHKRTLADGKIIPVSSSRVNWRSSEELHRMFYQVNK